jgi:hypothetical protein
MTDTLRQALRRDAANVEIPTLEAKEVIAHGEHRLHRRRMTAVVAAVAAVTAIAVGSVVATRTNPNTQQPLPVAPPSGSMSGTVAVDPHGARPVVYADGPTVHVGDKTIEARDPVAFIAATDDGAVYEAALDGRLWFTDGRTSSVIGTSGFAAAPTAHVGVVTTGDYGSLVVWADMAGRTNQAPVEFVVYDTSRREEVARIPFVEGGGEDNVVVYVDDERVYINPDPSAPGCWAVDVDDLRPCKDPQLFRFDVATDTTTKIPFSDLGAVLGRRARTFQVATQDGRVVHGEPAFALVGSRLVASIHESPLDDDATPVTLSDGAEVHLRMPAGYVPPWPADGEGAVTVSQWLDDTHVALFADDGGGDLPAKEGDLLVCQLPNGVCRVAVQRSSHPYVTP